MDKQAWNTIFIQSFIRNDQNRKQRNYANNMSLVKKSISELFYLPDICKFNIIE